MIELQFYNSESCLKIELPNEQVTEMHKICKESSPNETGGIIIGRYSDNGLVAYISEITCAPEDSIKGKSSFHRGNKGLKKKLDALWEQNYYYLGEWHYHPNHSPIPSKADIEQMRSFSLNRNLKCPEPILIIAGGNINNLTLNVMVIANQKTISFEEL